jgi:hypothetical protein
MTAPLLAILMLMLATSAASAQTPTLQVGPAELLYSQVPTPHPTLGVNFIDGSAATLKLNATTQCFWQTLADYTWKFCGPLNDPFRTLQPGWPKQITSFWKRPNGSAWSGSGNEGYLWMYNIYKIDATHLLAFVHKEYCPGCGVSGPGTLFALGLGYSSDSGETWTYLGDILQPQRTGGNVSGAPYLVVPDGGVNYFYVYFNEWPLSDPEGDTNGMSIARAPVTAVVAAAANLQNVTWVKYSGGGVWNTNAFSGAGASVLPPPSLYPPELFNGHGDAAWIPSLNKYIYAGSRPWIFLSDDAVNWPLNQVITFNELEDYPTFVSLDPAASDDSSTVGPNFVMTFARNNLASLWRTVLTVTGPLPPPPPPAPSNLTVALAPPGQSFTLTTAKAGTGSGTITGSGINCGSDCSESFPSGTQVELSQSAAGGSTFTGWSGACSGSGACSVTMSQARNVVATFNTAVAGNFYWEETFENHLNNGAVGSRDQTQWDTGACGGGFWGGTPPYIDGCNGYIVTSPVHRGSHALRSDYTGAAVGDCGKVPPNFPALECGRYYDRYFPDTTPEIWVRYWHRWDNHVEPNVSEKHLMIFGIDPSGASKLEVYVQTRNNGQQLFVTQTVSGSPRQCENGLVDTECSLVPNVGPVLSMNDGQWHCIEARFVKDTSVDAGDGIAQGWIDSTMVINYSHSFISQFQTNAQPWNMLRHFTQQGGGTRYTDDLAVGPTRIGCN